MNRRLISVSPIAAVFAALFLASAAGAQDLDNGAAVLTLAALERRGIENPGEHIAVVLGRDILGPPFATVLARLEPFTRAEIEKIQGLAESRGAGIAWVPGGPSAGVGKDLAEATSLEAFVAGYPLEISPPTDDKPKKPAKKVAAKPRRKKRREAS